MKTELIFPTPVWKFDNVGIDKQSLTDFVYHVKSEDPAGRKQSNNGGWQSHDFTDAVMQTNPLIDIRNSIIERAYVAADDFGFRSYSLHITNLWININGKGHYNHLHAHPGSILSGVYYVKLPPCCHGALSFIRRYEEQMMKESWGNAHNFDPWEDHNLLDYDVYPEEDLMVLFPSWLQHTVAKNTGDGERISLSFNLVAHSDFYHEIYPSR